MGRQALVEYGLLIVEASRSHSYTPHSVGVLWTSDKPVEGTSNWQNITFTKTDIHAPGGIRTLNPSNRAAPDPRRRPRETGIGYTIAYSVKS